MTNRANYQATRLRTAAAGIALTVALGGVAGAVAAGSVVAGDHGKSVVSARGPLGAGDQINLDWNSTGS
ncbi:hypothetical protein [Kitasatospora sp. GP82]|uniref:hypothetical protein n=1 Tax=Kitasatospora sp. GP82 TaxID=3035089 RepID=UPI00247451EA|nr:hypothetical protein [Kitasatospora sp. GP82]MDH6124003.1 hypothetical protein [Kitasatospora sp. GP82]